MGKNFSALWILTRAPSTIFKKGVLKLPSTKDQDTPQAQAVFSGGLILSTGNTAALCHSSRTCDKTTTTTITTTIYG